MGSVFRYIITKAGLSFLLDCPRMVGSPWICRFLGIQNDNRKIVRELMNIELFSQVSVDMDTLVWPNGFDLAPEYLYELSLALHIA